ncbi:MAG: hypothetical protein CMO46_00990, partial [Verrucomicrobiales bacterium]|nr:hypothetical protein [Verrucomicrobiales bacterium]
MKKPIILSVLFFIISAISSFGQGIWIEEEFSEGGPEFGLKTGKIEINGNIYEIKPNANLFADNLRGANLIRARLNGANLSLADLADANLEGANLEGANLDDARLFEAKLEGAKLERAKLERADLIGA